MSKKQQYQPPVALGPSNEELLAKQKAFEEKVARGEACRVSVLSDAEDKRIDGNGDEHFDYDDAFIRNPMEASIAAHKEPGMAYRLMSDRCTNHFGGTNGYQPVIDENGDPVKLGNMTWGKIPQRVADRRKKALEAESKEKLANIQNDQASRIAALKGEANELGLRVLEGGDSVRNIGDGQDYDMGITVERGPLTPGH